MRFFRLDVEADAADEDLVAALLDEAADGAGVEILDWRAVGLLPELGTLARDRVLVRAYVPHERLADLHLNFSGVPSARVFAPVEISDDWKERWKAFFRPTRVGERIVVRPPWEAMEDLLPSDVELVIEPGMAFGTGTHETTRLCLRALERLDLVGAHVLDVGCGSGVLSIAAIKLGAESATAIDIDDAAIDATRGNALTNRVAEHVSVSTTPLAAIDGESDVVLANILSSILVDLSRLLGAHVRVGGTLLLSGILAGEADYLGRVYAEVGLTEVERHSDADWVCLVCRRTR